MNAAAAMDSWLRAPGHVRLPASEKHLWRADAVSFSMHETMLTGLLSRAELDKANSFRQRPDRMRSILARAALRDILGRYMDADPRSLRFLASAQGKPMLDPDHHAGAPRFSVSHSGNIVLFAFARDHEVGVDVEVIRDGLDMLEIAQRFFAPGETAELLALPDSIRTRAFFTGWTRKEAYLKARSEGIGAGLNRFAVTLTPGRPARLLSDERYPDEVPHWRLDDIGLGAEYSAASAIRGAGWHTRYWIW